MPRGQINIPVRVPTGGERGDIPDHELDINNYRLLSNMLRSSQGRLDLRPGFEPLATTGPTGRIMGLAYFRNESGG